MMKVVSVPIEIHIGSIFCLQHLFSIQAVA